jgi:hypothetical protein
MVIADQHDRRILPLRKASGLPSHSRKISRWRYKRQSNYQERNFPVEFFTLYFAGADLLSFSTCVCGSTQQHGSLRRVKTPVRKEHKKDLLKPWKQLPTQSSVHIFLSVRFFMVHLVSSQYWLAIQRFRNVQEQTASRVKLDVSTSTRVQGVSNPIKGKCCCSTLSVPIIRVALHCLGFRQIKR